MGPTRIAVAAADIGSSRCQRAGARSAGAQLKAAIFLRAPDPPCSGFVVLGGRSFRSLEQRPLARGPVAYLAQDPLVAKGALVQAADIPALAKT